MLGASYDTPSSHAETAANAKRGARGGQASDRELEQPESSQPESSQPESNQHSARKHGAKGRGEGTVIRLREAPRRLFHAALALVSVLVGVGMMSAWLGTASLRTTMVDVAADTAASEGRPSVPHAAYEPSGARDRLDLVAEESDLAEEDPLCDLPEDSSFALPALPLARELQHARRREIHTAASDFVAGPGLPRGPPA